MESQSFWKDFRQGIYIYLAFSNVILSCQHVFISNDAWVVCFEFELECLRMMGSEKRWDLLQIIFSINLRWGLQIKTEKKCIQSYNSWKNTVLILNTWDSPYFWVETLISDGQRKRLTCPMAMFHISKRLELISSLHS